MSPHRITRISPRRWRRLSSLKQAFIAFAAMAIVTAEMPQAFLTPPAAARAHLPVTAEVLLPLTRADKGPLILEPQQQNEQSVGARRHKGRVGSVDAVVPAVAVVPVSGLPARDQLGPGPFNADIQALSRRFPCPYPAIAPPSLPS